jgi:hypothetical protein
VTPGIIHNIVYGLIEQDFEGFWTWRADLNRGPLITPESGLLLAAVCRMEVANSFSPGVG